MCIDTVSFKHQYITNPAVSPETHIITAAQQLTAALKGNIPRGNDKMMGLTKVRKLFTKIAMSKKNAATATAQQNTQHTHPTMRQTPLLPRVVTHDSRVPKAAPRVAVPMVWQRVTVAMVDSHVTRDDFFTTEDIVASPRCRAPTQPNYISQDDYNMPIKP